MPDIYITIAICTWNRSASLRNTLSILRDMEVPADAKWEVLVINNNYTDDTKTVVASFADVRAVIESQQGISHACGQRGTRKLYPVD